MKFFTISALAAFAAQASAVTLSLWSNTRGCSGSYVSCSSLARNTCCYKAYTANFGSFQAGGIHPSGSVAYGYQYSSGGYCGNRITSPLTIPAQGTTCSYSYPYEGTFAGTQWFAGSSRRSIAEGEAASNTTSPVEAEWAWTDGFTSWVISVEKEATLKDEWVDLNASNAEQEAFFKKHADKVRPLHDDEEQDE